MSINIGLTSKREQEPQVVKALGWGISFSEMYSLNPILIKRKIFFHLRSESSPQINIPRWIPKYSTSRDIEHFCTVAFWIHSYYPLYHHKDYWKWT